jgi:acyl carrier protein
MSEVEENLRNLLTNILDLSSTTDFEALGSASCERWDSFRHLSIVLAAEESFGITFDELEIATLMDYGALRAAIIKHTSQ